MRSVAPTTWPEVHQRSASRIAPKTRRHLHDGNLANAEQLHTPLHANALLPISKVFFEDPHMPRPAVFLGVGSGTHGAQTARIILAYEEHVLNDRPDMIIVVSDVNSTLAGALVGTKLHLPVAHVEAVQSTRAHKRTWRLSRMPPHVLQLYISLIPSVTSIF
jgi:hypothetical protein